MKTAQKKAVISGGIAERAKATMELVRQLKQVREQKLEVEPFVEDEWGYRDEAMADAMSALTLSEQELRVELRKAANRGEPLPKEKGFLDKLFSSDEDEDAESESDDEKEEEEL